MNRNKLKNCGRSGWAVRRSAKRSRTKQLVSESEFWIFIGILLAVNAEGGGGEKLWETEEARQKVGIQKHTPVPDFGCGFMTKVRFDEIWKTFPFAFGDPSKSDPNSATFDPWWPILGLIDGFNENRHKSCSFQSKDC